MVRIITVLSVIWALFQVYVSSVGVMETIKTRVWFFGFLVVMIFLLFPASKKERSDRRLPTWWDMLLIAASIVTVVYFLYRYDIYAASGMHNHLDYVFGTLGVVITFEAARRAAGTVLTILALVFLLYNFLGQYVPGILQTSSFGLSRVIDVMWWGTQGIFGVILGVASTYIFLFILFGAFLRKSGFIDFINELAVALTGRSSGGPAKVAVIGSGLMGMINGSGVANAASVGTVTIPLMKRNGLPGHVAAAVEAVAGTGGTIAPPIMGAASFVMAEFIGVPYREIMLAAIVPAILYYSMTFMSVHFEAKKLGLSGLSKEEIPNVIHVLKRRGHLLLPVLLIVVLLVDGMTPLYAAPWAMLAIIVASWFRKETRLGFREIVEAVEDGVKGVLTISAACAIVGVVVGTIALTSLGLTLGNNILMLSGNHLFLVALLTMLISILLGMGVPITASYIITATVAAPLLVKMGVPILVAHMFAFFYAALSDIIPPVALAVMVASGIAQEPFSKVSFAAMRLGFIGLVIPYFFLYNPALLFHGGSIAAGFISAILGVIAVTAFASSFSNYLFKRLNITQRLMLLAAGVLLIFPGYQTGVVGLVLFAAVILWQKLTLRSITAI
ncbi:TRAP transporter permease [Alicyclobacillus sp. SO9]|nr:TRAP transporter permease [Alicyclobacillus sp. SO9]